MLGSWHWQGSNPIDPTFPNWWRPSGRINSRESNTVDHSTRSDPDIKAFADSRDLSLFFSRQALVLLDPTRTILPVSPEISNTSISDLLNMRFLSTVLVAAGLATSAICAEMSMASSHTGPAISAAPSPVSKCASAKTDLTRKIFRLYPSVSSAFGEDSTSQHGGVPTQTIHFESLILIF